MIKYPYCYYCDGELLQSNYRFTCINHYKIEVLFWFTSSYTDCLIYIYYNNAQIITNFNNQCYYITDNRYPEFYLEDFAVYKYSPEELINKCEKYKLFL